MIRSEHVSREWLDGSVHDVLLKAAPIVPCRSTSRIPDCTGSPSPDILRVLGPGAAASMARHSNPLRSSRTIQVPASHHARRPASVLPPAIPSAEP